MKISCGMLWGAGFLILSCVWASAQEVTGVLGSPEATTTITGKRLPSPDPKFGGVIKERGLGIDSLVVAARRAAEWRSQRAAHYDG